MSVLSSTQKRRRRIPNKVKLKSMGHHDEFLSRIKKTLYYGKIPLTERFSLPVSELAAELYTNVKSRHSLERLCVDETAEISRNACVSPCSLILALFYLERLKTCNPDYIDRVSPSELFVVSMMVASKFLHDDGEEDEVFSSEWASSAGIDVNELNCYEKEFLNAINWEVFVNETEFWTGLKGVEREVARREGRRRGWFSYTEMLTLLDLVDAWSLAHTLVMVSVVCLTSYTASVMTLIGSAMITSQINVPELIASNLQQRMFIEPEQINITKGGYFSFTDVNITCLGEHLVFVNDKSVLSLDFDLPPASLSSSSMRMPSSWLLDSTIKTTIQDNNDSQYDVLLHRSDAEKSLVGEDLDISGDEKMDQMTNVMKIMRVTLENDELNLAHLLTNYFEKSSSISLKTATDASMDWLIGLFPLYRSSVKVSPSTPVSLPSIDVTL